MPGGKYYEYITKDFEVSYVQAKVKGLLYDLKIGYPALLSSKKNWVKGYLLNFNNSNVLKKFDQLEGYIDPNDNSKNEYSRIRIAVFKLDGNYIIDAWCYVMDKAQLSCFDYQIIESGDWQNNENI